MAVDEELLQFDYEWREGDRLKARDIAVAYIESHPALEDVLSRYTLEGLVREIDGLRAAGRQADRIITDMWLMARFEPQIITGELTVALPRPSAIMGVTNE